jgi:hypothetical protein
MRKLLTLAALAVIAAAVAGNAKSVVCPTGLGTPNGIGGF